MERWIVPDHMKQLADKSTRFFGYDQQGTIEYNFNKLGFRTGNTDGNLAINLIGNSISFGVGLEYNQTFGSILANNLGRKLNNFSFGCYLHENHDHLTNIETLSNQDSDDIFVIQINNLDRKRLDSNLVVIGNNQEFCKKRFLDYFDQVTSLLKNKTTIFIYWDNIEYDLPKSITDQILIFNKFHIDFSLDTRKDTFGPKTNQIISKIITASITADSIL